MTIAFALRVQHHAQAECRVADFASRQQGVRRFGIDLRRLSAEEAGHASRALHGEQVRTLLDVLLIDAAVPISQVDRQLANEIIMHHRPCVIVVNKWDLAEQNYTQQQYADYLDDALKGLDFAPLVFASARKGQGVRDAVAMALNLYDQAGHRVATGELNRVMEQVLARHMPASKLGKRPKVYYVTQLDTDPPTIALFVNDPSLFDAGYQRYVINRLRDLLPFSEVPIKLLIRGKQKMTAEQRLASEQSSDK